MLYQSYNLRKSFRAFLGRDHGISAKFRPPPPFYTSAGTQQRLKS
jgi:hypothetical protein